MDWLGKLLALPEAFLSRDSSGELQAGGGVIQGTASEAALVCMLAARARTMQNRPVSDRPKLVAYTSDQVSIDGLLLPSALASYKELSMCRDIAAMVHVA